MSEHIEYDPTTAKCLEQEAQIAQLTKERDQLAAKCAEMRTALQSSGAAWKKMADGLDRVKTEGEQSVLLGCEVAATFRLHQCGCEHALSDQCGQPILDRVKRLEEALEATKDVVTWAQCTLTGLNVGSVQSESPLHLKLREVIIAYRAKQALSETEAK